MEGVNFCGGKFGDLCRSRCIKQELTTADCPQFNGVAERALGLIETAAMAGRIQESPGDPCYEVGESQLTNSQTYILLVIWHYPLAHVVT